MLLFAKKSTLISFTVLISTFLQTTFTHADSNTEIPVYQEKLDYIQQNIVKTQQHLQATRSQRGHTLTELRQLESDISNNALALKKTGRKIKSINKRIVQLRASLKLLSRRLKKQRYTLGEQLRAAYALGSHQNVKMLLNQQDPAEIGRIQAYFNYLNKAREDEIQQFIVSIEKNVTQEQELSKNLIAHKAALDTRKEQKQLLKKQRIKRNQLLITLNNKILNQEQTLSGLETSRNKIEGLLRSLGQLLADIPAAPNDKKPFKQQKGLLPWPVKGPLLSRFGESRNQGDLKWNGILIGSSYGVAVRSITHGRIAFSDWLQGYGFIIIVDHGDGYMSLYGHNETLLKHAGDWVTAGETIATTGDSGGQPNPGLYFEIRSRGKPIDPYPWCSLKATHKASL